jgi:hypothetical protein
MDFVLQKGKRLTDLRGSLFSAMCALFWTTHSNLDQRTRNHMEQLNRRIN